MDRYMPNGVCVTCGANVGNLLAHDLFHSRLNLMYDAIPVSMIETSGHPITDLPNEEEPRKCAVCGEPVWVSPSHCTVGHRSPFGKDHAATLTPPERLQECGLCGHEASYLGGSENDTYLCHDCALGHDCYTRWTVHGVRPHTDDCRDLYCGGCEEVKDDAPHADPCDCDDCRPQQTLHRQPDAPTERIVMHNYDSEPPVGAVARCFGCGNVYVHKADGWVNTDDGSRGLAWVGFARSFCGPVKVIYGPGEDE